MVSRCLWLYWKCSSGAVEPNSGLRSSTAAALVDSIRPLSRNWWFLASQTTHKWRKCCTSLCATLPVGRQPPMRATQATIADAFPSKHRRLTCLLPYFDVVMQYALVPAAARPATAALAYRVSPHIRWLIMRWLPTSLGSKTEHHSSKTIHLTL